jgi:thiol-disulfide isomerase/thioredoxin
LSLDEAMKTARAEKKLVFVDCYTTWCGPCKYMAASIFPQKEAGDFFNRHFVNVKFDMEKGEGIELQKKFGVTAYPTFLVLTPDGEERYRVVGGGELAEFIPRVERGLSANNNLTALKNEYAKGKMPKARKLAYIIALRDAYDNKSKEIATELLAQLSTAEKLSPAFWPLLNDHSDRPSFETLEFVVKNIAIARKKLGKEEVSKFLETGYTALLNQYISSGGTAENGAALIASIRERVAREELATDDALEARLEIATAFSNGKPAEAVELVEKYLPRFPLNERFGFMFAFQRMDMQNKELMAKIVKVGDAIIAQSPDEDGVKKAVEQYFEPFRRAATVGVYWENYTLEQALGVAKANKKLVFVDCYTTWCGPCKHMADNVFPRPEVGEFFNKNFVNVKYDMEAGDGPEIAKRYRVRAYPTFLILNPDGTIRHKILGSTEEIIQEAEKGLDETQASGTLDKKYDEGNRDKAFLIGYAKSLVDLYDAERAREVCAELDKLLSDEERTSSDYWFMYEDNTLAAKDSENFKYLLAHKKAFERSIGKEIVDEKISSLYIMELYTFFFGQKEATPATFDAMKREVSSCKLTKQREVIACIELVKGVSTGNTDNLMKTCKKAFRNLTEENFQFGAYALNHLKQHITPEQLPRLKALAATLEKQMTSDNYKEYFSRLFEERAAE